jgi:hypothetical protein
MAVGGARVVADEEDEDEVEEDAIVRGVLDNSCVR